ncbi:YezD family protein [Methylomonas paludis]|uniref:YezD family protein n=1 Tax=Methylomonas paludis TaxID=1173101 RepID=A0A975MPV7_9GAMM|nr:YezD family protein [Methylomonas paludis]QWF71843.1 YezD family protein [Methylomonas paludis]
MAVTVNSNTLKNDDIKEVALYVATLIQDIRFGSVEVVVHDGRVVQIDKRERFRLNDQKNSA